MTSRASSILAWPCVAVLAGCGASAPRAPLPSSVPEPPLVAGAPAPSAELDPFAGHPPADLGLPADLELPVASGGIAPPSGAVPLYVSTSAMLLGRERQPIGSVPERTALAQGGFEASADPAPIPALAAALPPSRTVAVYLERSLPYRALADIAATLRARGLRAMHLVTHQRRADAERTRALEVGLSSEAAPDVTIDLGGEGYEIRRGPESLACPGVTKDAPVSLPLKDKTYDYAGLRACVLEVLAAERSGRLQLSADPLTSYHNLISTLDILERDERGEPLFDTISLSPFATENPRR